MRIAGHLLTLKQYRYPWPLAPGKVAEHQLISFLILSDMKVSPTTISMSIHAPRGLYNIIRSLQAQQPDNLLCVTYQKPTAGRMQICIHTSSRSDFRFCTQVLGPAGPHTVQLRSNSGGWGCRGELWGDLDIVVVERPSIFSVLSSPSQARNPCHGHSQESCCVRQVQALFSAH